MELEKAAEQIKNGEEAALKENILAHMSAEGIKSAHVEGLGRVVSRVTSHYEIVDMEKLVKQMFTLMIKSLQDGKPITDALLLQARVHKGNLEDYLERGEAVDTFGVRCVDKNDLSFTVERSGN